jgi:hypothetical protein
MADVRYASTSACAGDIHRSVAVAVAVAVVVKATVRASLAVSVTIDY